MNSFSQCADYVLYYYISVVRRHCFGFPKQIPPPHTHTHKADKGMGWLVLRKGAPSWLLSAIYTKVHSFRHVIYRSVVFCQQLWHWANSFSITTSWLTCSRFNHGFAGIQITKSSVHPFFADGKWSSYLVTNVDVFPWPWNCSRSLF